MRVSSVYNDANCDIGWLHIFVILMNLKIISILNTIHKYTQNEKNKTKYVFLIFVRIYV